jgi:hypothetical protein
MTTQTISVFFSELGFPFRNKRWSWGAHGKEGILLRVWEDDRIGSRFVRVLGPRFNRSPKKSDGLSERIEHLRLLWGGGLAAYVVVAKAVDESATPRVIESFDRQRVYAIAALVPDSDGSILAELGSEVPTAKIARHSRQYRIQPAAATFPKGAEESALPLPNSAPYLEKLPAMRSMLIEVARQRKTLSYAAARRPFNFKTFEHRHAMDRLGNECLAAGEPILTSLIVDEVTGRCSSGFEKEFHRDDEQERMDCYEFWSEDSTSLFGSASALALPTHGTKAHDGETFLQNEALKFSSVAVRPWQAVFRRRVFTRFVGTCALSGCPTRQALDAAHRLGRDWRKGHNKGSDGLLLRKDLHALYDAGLIVIQSDGTALFDPELREHYADLHQKTIKVGW